MQANVKGRKKYQPPQLVHLGKVGDLTLKNYDGGGDVRGKDGKGN